MTNILSKLKDIKYFIFDVDGVFTDGGLLVTENGELLRRMNAKDGFALRHAVDTGYEVIIITGGNSKGVKSRFEALGLTEVHIAVKDKLALLQKLEQEGKVDPTKSLYMGDDVPDIDIMKKIAFRCCPNDAIPEIKEISHLITTKKGGEGCVREVVEATLRVQDNWL